MIWRLLATRCRISSSSISFSRKSSSFSRSAARLWVTGAIGASVGLGSCDVAVVLTLVTIATSWIMSPLKRLGNLDVKKPEANVD